MGHPNLTLWSFFPLYVYVMYNKQARSKYLDCSKSCSWWRGVLCRPGALAAPAGGECPGPGGGFGRQLFFAGVPRQGAGLEDDTNNQELTLKNIYKKNKSPRKRKKSMIRRKSVYIKSSPRKKSPRKSMVGQLVTVNNVLYDSSFYPKESTEKLT